MTYPLIALMLWPAIAPRHDLDHLPPRLRAAIVAAVPNARTLRTGVSVDSGALHVPFFGTDAQGRKIRGGLYDLPDRRPAVLTTIPEDEVPGPVREQARKSWPEGRPGPDAIERWTDDRGGVVYVFSVADEALAFAGGLRPLIQVDADGTIQRLAP